MAGPPRTARWIGRWWHTLETLLARADLGAETRIRLLDALVSEVAGEDDPRIITAGDEAIALARTLDDPRLLAVALATGIKATHVDTLTDRRYEFAAELERLTAGLDMPAFHWFATYAMASVAGARGEVHTLRARLAAGKDLAQRYRMAEAEAIQSFGDAMLAHVAGRFDEAERIYLEAADRMDRAGSVHAEGFLGVALCTLRLSQGRVGELEAAAAGADPAVRRRARRADAGTDRERQDGGGPDVPRHAGTGAAGLLLHRLRHRPGAGRGGPRPAGRGGRADRAVAAAARPTARRVEHHPRHAADRAHPGPVVPAGRPGG